MQTDLSTYNNEWYQPGPAFKRACWYLVNEVVFKSAFFPFYGFKNALLRLFGARVGRKVCIKPGVNIKYPWLLTLGDYTWIGEKVWIDNLASVTIGAHACLSQGAMLLCGNHDYSKSTFDLAVKPIVIEDGVWIGAHAVVCGGLTCYSHAVLSVGSVANRDLLAYHIYRGNPAESIKVRVIT